MEENSHFWKFQSMISWLCFFWSCVKVPHLCEEHVVEERFLPPGGQEVKKRKNKGLTLLFPSRTQKQPTVLIRPYLLRFPLALSSARLGSKSLLCEPFRDFFVVLFLFVFRDFSDPRQSNLPLDQKDSYLAYVEKCIQSISKKAPKV